MISDERVEAAVIFYRDHAAVVGQLRGQKSMLEHKIKIIRSQKFLSVDGTVAERESMAMASPEYREVVEELKDCITELDTLVTQLKAAELTIEVYRTQAANTRRGNI